MFSPANQRHLVDLYTLLHLILAHFLVFANKMALKYVLIVSVYASLITDAASHLTWYFFATCYLNAYLLMRSIFLLGCTIS